MNTEKLTDILISRANTISNFKTEAFKSWKIDTIDNFKFGYEEYTKFSVRLDEINMLISYIKRNPEIKYSRLKNFLLNRIENIYNNPLKYCLCYQYDMRIHEIGVLEQIIAEAEKCEN